MTGQQPPPVTVRVLASAADILPDGATSTTVVTQVGEPTSHGTVTWGDTTVSLHTSDGEQLTITVDPLLIHGLAAAATQAAAHLRRLAATGQAHAPTDEDEAIARARDILGPQ